MSFSVQEQTEVTVFVHSEHRAKLRGSFDSEEICISSQHPGRMECSSSPGDADGSSSSSHPLTVRLRTDRKLQPRGEGGGC